MYHIYNTVVNVHLNYLHLWTYIFSLFAASANKFNINNNNFENWKVYSNFVQIWFFHDLNFQMKTKYY